MLIAGEVQTAFLRGSDPVEPGRARRLVDLVVGEPVLVSTRPIAHVRSPQIPVGVDCRLGTAGSTRQVRGVGTALQRAAITGGHILQGSAYATFAHGEGGARRPWSHYLARPGVIETLSRVGWDELAVALTGVEASGASLDLAAMAGRVADRVQRSVPRGGTVRLRSARTRLRWVASVEASGAVRVGFSVRGGDLRTLRLTVPFGTAGELAAACEDVALHDWLLSSLLEITDKSAIGVLPREQALTRLLPAIDYLLHLWMPGARGVALTDEIWRALEARPGFTRQWDSVVHRIRDQLSVGAVASLAASRAS
ncbi:SCO2521 family protein [Actinoplanes sp. NPDC049118]|uniref:SCO2521 family protein n=1 Tax=Actinoplanes sp. NPDC049118 TaxID=3155769 RepID=UPI0033D7D2E4